MIKRPRKNPDDVLSGTYGPVSLTPATVAPGAACLNTREDQ
jgi:hypothetical protein